MKPTKLKECPQSPNCVSTQTDQVAKKMDSLPFQRPPQEVQSLIKEVVARQPRTRLLKEEDGYLHFTFTSLIFRFKDDVEFLIDGENKLVHFRSASRVGHSDLGANRKRMDRLSKEIVKSL